MRGETNQEMSLTKLREKGRQGGARACNEEKRTHFLLSAIPALASKVEEAEEPRKSVETTSSSV